MHQRVPTLLALGLMVLFAVLYARERLASYKVQEDAANSVRDMQDELEAAETSTRLLYAEVRAGTFYEPERFLEKDQLLVLAAYKAQADSLQEASMQQLREAETVKKFYYDLLDIQNANGSAASHTSRSELGRRLAQALDDVIEARKNTREAWASFNLLQEKYDALQRRCN